MQILLNVLAIAATYLFASFSSAIITCKVMGLPDPRTAGSGNPGATNVLRVGDKKAALITLVGDAFKGYLPVKIVIALGFSPYITALVIFAAFLGHVFPLYFNFKGGKGVATGIGTLFAVNMELALIIAVIWLIIFILFRFSSLAALTAVGVGLVFAHSTIPDAAFASYCVIAIILFWRHRGNIERLIKGTEAQFMRS